LAVDQQSIEATDVIGSTEGSARGTALLPVETSDAPLNHTLIRFGTSINIAQCERQQASAFYHYSQPQSMSNLYKTAVNGDSKKRQSTGNREFKMIQP